MVESGEKGPLEDLALKKDEPFPIGEYLARQRKVRGLSLEELEEITRIPVRSLERLEAGAFDGESDGFARGFVRAVAEALGLDAEDATMLMLAEPHVDSIGGHGLSNPLRLGLAVVLLLLLGSMIWFLRRPQVEEHLEVPVKAASPVRRDAVRVLAEEEGLLTSGALSERFAAPEAPETDAAAREVPVDASAAHPGPATPGPAEADEDGPPR